MRVGYPQKSTFGIITADEVQTPVVNNPAGDLNLRTVSTNRLILSSSYAAFYRNLAIKAGYSILDDGDNILIDPDDAGRITTLAPVDGAIGFASENNTHWLSAMQTIFSGGLGFYLGWYNSVATETLVFNLSPLLSKINGELAKISNIKIYYYTVANGDYITETRLQETYNNGSTNTRETDSVDKGNGSAVTDSFDLPVSPSLGIVGRNLYLEFDVVYSGGGNGNCFLGFEVSYDES